MKILFITESFPYPLDSGGKIVSYQTLQMLSGKHSVHLVAMNDLPPSPAAIRAIQSLGIKVEAVISKKRGPWYKQSKRELFSSIVRLHAAMLYPFFDSGMANKIKTVLASSRFDVIHIDHLSMARYLPKEKNTAWILQEHNLESRLIQDFYRFSPKFSKEKLYYLYNAWALKRYEFNVLRQVDQIILLSHQDKEILRDYRIPSDKMLVVPPWTSVQTMNKSKKQPFELLFIGNLWWKPNLDAMLWFMKDIFPIIQRRNPSVRLTIIGEGVNQAFTDRRNNPNVMLLEKQKNINQFLSRAGCFVLPFRIGEGVRIKALTAMSHGIPIVSTDVGMRGLRACAGQEYLSSNNSSGFANQTLRLLQNPELCKTLVVAGDYYLKKYHNKSVIKSFLLKHYARDSMSV